MRADLIHDALLLVHAVVQDLMAECGEIRTRNQVLGFWPRLCHVFYNFFYFLSHKAYFGLQPHVWETLHSGSAMLDYTQGRWKFNYWPEGLEWSEELIAQLQDLLHHRYHSFPFESFPQPVDLSLFDNEDLVYFTGIGFAYQSGNFSYLLFDLRQSREPFYEQTTLWHTQKAACLQLYRDYVKEKKQLGGADYPIERFFKERGLRPDSVQVLFKHHFGTTFYGYHLQCRLIEALRQILCTERSLKEIAHHTGFSSDQVFIQAFTKGVGISPMRFRKQRF